MDRRSFIFLDATLESHAPFFAESPIFKTWLTSYNNIPDALQFISQKTLPYSIQVYIAKDNILDDGLPSDINGQTRTIIETFCDLKTIQCFSVFAPTVNTDLEQQIRSIISQPRALKDVISVIDLHAYMCREGINYLTEERRRYISTNDVHLIPNLQQNIDELMEYLERVMNDRKKIIDTLIEARSNQPGEQPL